MRDGIPLFKCCIILFSGIRTSEERQRNREKNISTRSPLSKKKRKIHCTTESNGGHAWLCLRDSPPSEPFRNTLGNTQDEARNKKTSLSFLPGIYAGVVRGVTAIKSASADARARRKAGLERGRAVAKVVADIIMLAETAEIAALKGSRRPPSGVARPSRLRKSGVMQEKKHG